MNDSNNAHSQKDLAFIRKAIELAKLSESMGEVPVGALIVDEMGAIISQSTNRRESKTTALGHAELISIHRACKKTKNWRLSGLTLYVTLEPCFMCAGALVQSRIKRVVFGAYDPKGGALGSLANLAQNHRLNHRFEVQGGVLAEECSDLLKKFFKSKRKSSTRI